MNKKYDPVIDFASFQKWREDFSRGIQDVVDADSREQMGKNVGAVLTRSLDAIFEQTGASPAKPGSRYSAADQATTEAADESAWTPSANCAETNTAYLIEVELAGVSMQQVDVEISGNRLIVSGVAYGRATAESAKPVFRPAGFSKTERRSGKFERVFELPADSDIDAVDASMEHGLLTVSIARQTSNRRVKVELRPG